LISIWRGYPSHAKPRCEGDHNFEHFCSATVIQRDEKGRSGTGSNAFRAVLGVPEREQVRVKIPNNRLLALSSRRYDVFVVAQVASRVPITDEAWERLIDTGIMLRDLAGLPPPWDDPENIARTEAYMRDKMHGSRC
jgi:hypothetical protein